jgi:hypothetical protein
MVAWPAPKPPLGLLAHPGELGPVHFTSTVTYPNPNKLRETGYLGIVSPDLDILEDGEGVGDVDGGGVVGADEVVDDTLEVKSKKPQE